MREGEPSGDGHRPAASGSTTTRCASRSSRRSGDGDEARAARPRAARDRRLRAPRRGLRRARRRRAADPPRARPALGAAAGWCKGEGAAQELPLTREQIRRFEAHLRRELERAQIERTQALPPSRPLNDLDRALPSGPAAGPRGRAPRRRPAQRRLATQGHNARGHRTPRARRRAAHDARLAADRRRAGRAQVPAAPAAPPRALRALRRLHVSVTSRQRLLPLRAARAARHVPADALVRVRRAHLRGHRRLRRASARSRRSRDAISKDAGVADVSGYTDYGRVWREFLVMVEDDLHPRATVIVLGDARTNGRDPRADIFAHIAEQGRAHVLAEPRAAAVLELRRLGDRRLRAVLRGLRVLDDARSSRTSSRR